MNSTPVGKIEDAGNLVKGGGIDRYWNRQGLSLDFKKLFNDSLSAPWLFDSELALAHFKLRSIEFGNWMSQKDRANFLYSSALSLQHLALLYDLKPHQIGMNGKLSLALGARGSGSALAHYEPLSRSVINLTKTKGIGSLAHEFAHALDNLISFHTGDKKQTYVSGGRTTRKGYDEDIAKNGNYFEKQFEELFNILYFNKKGKPTDFNIAISKGTDYLNRRNEVFARTFEVYTHYKLDEQGIKNEFLVKPSYKAKIYPSTKLVLKASKYIDNIIKRGFNLMKRNKALSGVELFTGYTGFRKTLKKNANLQDTLDNMQRIAYRDAPQVTALALSLKGNSVAQTSENIWNYLRFNTRYKLDTEGMEQLRTPARSLIDGKKGLTDSNYGIDCDDYSILISALLQNLQIKHEWRVTAYKTKGKFQHIYPVAFDEKGNAYVLDVVPEIPHFNHEAQPIIDLKIVPMELQELSGIDASPTSIALEQQQDLLEEFNAPFSLSGVDNQDDLDNEIFENSFLSGFGEVASEAEAEIVLNGTDDLLNLLERGILAEVYKAKNALQKELKNPTLLSQTLDVRKELSLLTTLSKVWNDDAMRDAAIQNGITASTGYKNFYKALQVSLEQFNDESLQGMDNETLEAPIYLAKVDMSNIAFDDLLDDPDPDLQGLGDLGRRRRRGFFRKVFRSLKRAGKKVGKFAKKAVKAVVKFNPLSIAIRASIRLVLRTNAFKIASRLIYGFLSEAQAKAKGLNLNEWKKLVRARKRAEKFYVKKMGGKASKFKRAIVRGRAAKKTGLRLGEIEAMGAAVTTASGTAAASPFIIFIKKILSKINPKKLFNKIAQKIKNKRSSNNSTATPSIFPETYNQPNTTTSLTTMNNPSLVPKQGFKAKMMNFFNKHKKRLISVGIVGAIAIIGVIFWQKNAQKKKRSLAGIKAAKTRARNRKRALAGLPAARRSTTRSTPTRKKRTATPRLAAAPVSGVKSRKRSNTSRLKAMHKKAKQLQKKHPRSKYSSLLKKAATMI